MSNNERTAQTRTNKSGGLTQKVLPCKTPTFHTHTWLHFILNSSTRILRLPAVLNSRGKCLRPSLQENFKCTAAPKLISGKRWEIPLHPPSQIETMQGETAQLQRTLPASEDASHSSLVLHRQCEGALLLLCACYQPRDLYDSHRSG